MSIAISFGNELSFKFELDDIELSAFGCTITALWYRDPFDGGFFVHKQGTDFNRHWTWPEIIHGLKFWRRDEFQWPEPTEQEKQAWAERMKVAAEQGETWPPHE